MKKHNPYRNIVNTLNRFRGLWQKAGRFNIDKAYTPESINLSSHKIGQLDSREGHTQDVSYVDGVINGDGLANSRFVGEGTNIFVEAKEPIAIYGVPTYNPPTTWNKPPWVPETPDSIDSCSEWWAMLDTPVGDQKVGGVFPDCFNGDSYTCDELWDRVATPLEYRKVGGVYPDCTTTPPIAPPIAYTCADLWTSAPALTAYEQAANATHDVRDGDTAPCWKLTCQDLWDTYPTYTTYEVTEKADLEMVETGGTGLMSECWDTTLNCQDLYAQNPEWDQYRTSGNFPDCWNFTTEVQTPTCSEFWAQYNIPEANQLNGTYPNCLKINPPILPPLGSCKSRMWDFPTGADSVSWELSSGYKQEETDTPVDFEVEGSMYSNEIPNSLRYEIIGTGETTDAEARATFIVKDSDWYYDYVNVDPPCRRKISYGLILQVAEDKVTSETPATGALNCYVSFGDFQNVLYAINLTAQAEEPMDFISMQILINERRGAIGLSPETILETTDFETYAQQLAIVQRWQSFIHGYSWQFADDRDMTDIPYNGTLSGQLYTYQYDAFYLAGGKDKNDYFYQDVVGGTLDTPSGIGFRRFIEDVATTSGSMQDGDDMEPTLFDDLGACLNQMKTTVADHLAILDEDAEDYKYTSQEVGVFGPASNYWGNVVSAESEYDGTTWQDGPIAVGRVIIQLSGTDKHESKLSRAQRPLLNPFMDCTVDIYTGGDEESGYTLPSIKFFFKADSQEITSDVTVAPEFVHFKGDPSYMTPEYKTVTSVNIESFYSWDYFAQYKYESSFTMWS